ncbi:MAG: hypothetical protein GF331_21760, partial [Chitinivibrionales bacterium]|nr:hypothetical protein [Chitinivibrionales bacterium]
QWIVTGNQDHADKAIEILNGWSASLEAIVNKPGEYDNQEVLVAGWHGEPLSDAAEIIRYSDAGWAHADIVRFEDMLKNVFVPLVDYHSTENGNWEASQINTLIAIGIFCNDLSIYGMGVDFFRGSGRGAVGVYIYDSGECQENCRDQGHSQMGLGELVDAAEMAWKQGVDLYGEMVDSASGLPRLAMGLEFTASIVNGVEQSTTCGTLVCEPLCGVDPMWEKAWNHYCGRMQLELPAVTACRDRSRPENESWKAMYAWGTLTHAEQVHDPVTVARGARRICTPLRTGRRNPVLFSIAGRRLRFAPSRGSAPASRLVFVAHPSHGIPGVSGVVILREWDD